MHAKSPGNAYSLFTLETCIDLIITALKFLVLSGPSKQCKLFFATPDLTIPETTRPTPSTANV